MSNFINYVPLKYQDYDFPLAANIFGVCFALSSASAIPIYGIYRLYIEKGNTFMEVINTKYEKIYQFF